MRHVRLSDARDQYLLTCEPYLQKRAVQSYRINYFIFHADYVTTKSVRPERLDRYLAYRSKDHLDMAGQMPGPLRLAPARPDRGRGAARQRGDFSGPGTHRNRLLHRVSVRRTPAMRVGDVNLDRGTIFIHVWKSMTEDEMAIFPELRQELLVWFTEYARQLEHLYKRGLLLGDHLFPGRRKHQYESWHVVNGVRKPRPAEPGPDPTRAVSQPQKGVAAALKKIGIIDERLGAHILRRSSARHIFDASVGDGYDGALRIIESMLLYHANSQATEIYIGLATKRRNRDEFLRSAALLTPYRAERQVAALGKRLG